MDTRNPRAYILFIIALAINAFGIAFITRAALGTSPITSITYVMSMFTPLSIGQWTIVLNLLFVLLELPFMSKDFLKADRICYLLQIPTTLLFGFFIDLSMEALSWFNPLRYPFKILGLSAGCIILAIGIALEVKANVAMAAGEYFVKVISKRFRTDFGFTKLGFDTSLVALSCIVSYVAMSGIHGVREGTVVAAVIVGPIVHFISPWFHVFDKFLGEKRAGMPPVPQPRHTVITIAREYGSGGHLLGQMIAKELGFKLYDEELIHLAAKESGMDEDYIRKNEQNLPSFWLKCIFAQNKNTIGPGMDREDVLFLPASQLIEHAPRKDDCVIVGRCADFILRDHAPLIRVFCLSDTPTAYKRCVEDYHVPAAKAEEEIKRLNRKRAAHYEYYTGGKWGNPKLYDLVINTSKISLETACRIVAALARDPKQTTGKKP